MFVSEVEDRDVWLVLEEISVDWEEEELGAENGGMTLVEEDPAADADAEAVAKAAFRTVLDTSMVDGRRYGCVECEEMSPRGVLLEGRK